MVVKRGPIFFSLSLLLNSHNLFASDSPVKSDGNSKFRASLNPRASLDAGFVEAVDLLKKERWSEAGLAFRNYYQKYPGHTASALGLASALIQQGRKEEALSLLGQVSSQLKPDEKLRLEGRVRNISRIFLTEKTYSRYQEGLLNLKTGQFKQARDRMIELREIEPDNIEILMRLGQAQLLEGDYDSSAETLRLAKKLNPFEGEIRIWLGRALMYRGELLDSIDELKSGKTLLPNSEYAAVWLSEALIVGNQLKAGIEILDADLKKNPEHVLSALQWVRLEILVNTSAKQQVPLVSPTDLKDRLKTVERHLARYLSRNEEELQSKEGPFFLNTLRSEEELRKEIEKLGLQTSR